MSKPLLDLSESSDEEVHQINVNTDFAKNYENWRRKEELQKLKDKYGDNLDILSDSEQSFVSGSADGSDTSQSESEESVGKDEQVFDDNFFKVYSALKCKNPIIYDKNMTFFNVTSNNQQNFPKEPKIKKEKTMTLIDYHKQLIKKKKGITDEDLQQMNGSEEKPIGYYEELDQIRNEFKSIINSSPTDENSGDELIKGKPQSMSPQNEKRVHFLDDIQNDSDLKYLKNYWKNDKQLEESERYLRDYILNKRYIDGTEKEDQLYRIPNQNETQVSESQSNDPNEANNGFETMDDINSRDKDNDIKISDFHFEEPDSLSLKRFPRNIETIRDTTSSDKRAVKRAQTKDRKKQEKQKELKRLRKWKKEELKQRLAKLQQISGNDKMDFNDLDLNVILDDDNEFDSQKYDQKMESLFGNDYYENDNSGDKPKFEYMPEIDDYECEDVDNNIETNEVTNDSKTNKLLDKKKKKMSKTMEEIGIFEDLIGGDLPTRYKYRTVESNDFGLTDEEILFSDDKELNKWCSIKKMSQYREDNEEKYDKKSYSIKAKNLEMKQKILKSFYEKQFPEQKSEEFDSNLNTNVDNNSNDNKKKRKRRNHKKPTFIIEDIQQTNGRQLTQHNKQQIKELIGETVDKNTTLNRNKRFKTFKRHNRQKQNAVQSPYPGVSVERLKAYGLSNRKIKKIKHKNQK